MHRFAYHATLAEFLPAIRDEGLRPFFSSAAGGEVIFCEPDLAGAAIYAEHRDGVLLRWALGPDEVLDCTPDGESVWRDMVPADRLEVLQGSRWARLSSEP